MKNKVNFPEEVIKELNNNFASFCLTGDIEKVKEYISAQYVENMAYENGLFGIYAAINGHDEVLKLIYAECPKIKEFGHDILNAAASYGQIKCIEFLLKEGFANPKELEGTSAYNNYSEVELLFNNYLKEHSIDICQEKEIIGGGHHEDVYY